MIDMVLNLIYHAVLNHSKIVWIQFMPLNKNGIIDSNSMKLNC